MTVIGLMAVRNEAWVLQHSLACVSGFCDVVFVCDQGSEDGSREVAGRFPKAVVVQGDPASDSAAGALRVERARWRLLDAARDYAGENLLWICDADELVSPRLARPWLERQRDSLKSGTVIECLFYNLWNTPATYRDDWTLYRPHWKAMAFVDDRRAAYPRDAAIPPLHDPRLPRGLSQPVVRAPAVPVLHLQWLITKRNQAKQAWYRCVELLEGAKTAAEINARYSITLPVRFVKTAPVPSDWVTDVTFPDFAIDQQASWHEREILGWFDEHGVEKFEPLEIWHVARLRDEFRRRTGRRPRPERSDARRWPSRTHDLGRRAAAAAWRRMFA